jgi:hypothetical protein
MKKFILLSLVCLSLVVIDSCAPKGAQFKMPQQIAVLPTINQTTDVLGAIVFRRLFYIELEEEYGAYLIPIEMVDTLLNEEGITQGGQLDAIENSDLFQILKSDGLLFIELLACDYQTLGVSETRRIKVHFSLIRPPEEKIWDFEYEVDEGKSAFDTFLGILGDPKEAFKDTAEDLGKQLAHKAGRMWLLNHALKPEMEMVIKEAMDDLP